MDAWGAAVHLLERRVAGKRAVTWPGRPVLLFFLGALALSAFLYRGLWARLPDGYLALNGSDQHLFEWFFALGADHVAHLSGLVHTSLQNAPDGVNLLANTSVLGLSIPFAPVTLLFGPAVTVVLVLTLGLAATATAWFWLFLRRLVPSPRAAAAGAAVCGFAPPVISHANGHVNFVAAFLVPLMIDRLLRLCAGERVVRNGIGLAALAAYQVFLGEELLLIAATGMALFAGAYAVADLPTARRAVRPLCRGLAVAGAVAVPVLAAPLAWQFFGPGSYRQIFWTPPTRPEAFVAFAGQTVGGNDSLAYGLSGPTEQNAFLGWPALALAVALVVALRRLPVARAAFAMGLCAGLLALGSAIPLPGGGTVPGPWRALGGLPGYDSLIEGRLAMLWVPGLGILVALGVQAVGRIPDATTRYVALGALAATLLPCAPTPFPAGDRAPVPALFADDAWRSYVRPGRTLVTAPLPAAARIGPLHWQVEAGLGFALAGGYFVGPDSSGHWGTYTSLARPTSDLFNAVDAGTEVVVDDAARAAAAADLAFWKADAIVVLPGAREAAMTKLVEDLLGRPGDQAGGLRVWRVRPEGDAASGG